MYGYNLGGQLDHVRGYKSYEFDYVSQIGYDKFEQINYLKYDNGAETFYTYDPQRRRLQNLAVTSSAGTIMDNAYSYDAVSNVLSITGAAPLPRRGKAGGQMSHTYGYDALYRLTSARGDYRGADGKSTSYNLMMGYDNMHRIKSKSQHLKQQGVQFDGTLNAGYDLTYSYQDSVGHKFQLSTIDDRNYYTEENPRIKINNDHRYRYDANVSGKRVQNKTCLGYAKREKRRPKVNGNLVYINTGRVKKDGVEDEGVKEKKYLWDEENHLLASDEDGFVTGYWYDADGERTVKMSGGGMKSMYFNGSEAATATRFDNFTLYVNPFFVCNNGGRYTKHIYLGDRRVASKLNVIGRDETLAMDWLNISDEKDEYIQVSKLSQKYGLQQASIGEIHEYFEVPYRCDTIPFKNSRNFYAQGETVTGDRLRFYYHPDHLGSSSYITNLDGEVVQHIEYVPFGEVFIEELEPMRKSAAVGKANSNNTWNTPYLFNAKEYDEETGMYYYGARYYEPRISLWMSTDPMQEKNFMVSSYCYSNNSPINVIDPDGRDGVRIIDDEAKSITIKADYYVVTGPAFYKGWNNKQKELKGYTAKDIENMNKYNDYLNRLDLKVPSGEYEGYSISFDLSFMDGGKSWEVDSKAEEDTYGGHPIGNTIRLGDERTYRNFNFEERENPDGTTSTVGGATLYNKIIVMNKPKDTKMNRIHEIFHTLGFSHPKGSGGPQGIMKYPPSDPTTMDALELSNTDFLPTIKK